MTRKNGELLIVPKREPLGVCDQRVLCDKHGPLCEGCPYPRHGLTCWFTDGTCLRTEMNRIMRKTKTEHGKEKKNHEKLSATVL